jgi:hypothetical protein
MHVLSRQLFCHRTFCPSGRFVPLDVLSHRMFFRPDVLCLRMFFPPDVLCLRMFFPTDVLSPNVRSPDVLSPDVLSGHLFNWCFFAKQVEVCTGLGNGELDFYNTMADLESSWANTSLQSPMVNFSGGQYFEVWLPFRKNPASGNYAHVQLDQGGFQFDSSITLNGSPLWSPGFPSIMRKKCVGCASSLGCYDEDCTSTMSIHKCKFSKVSLLHLQGLCEETLLGMCTHASYLC